MSDNLRIEQVPYEKIDTGLRLIWEVFQKFVAPDYEKKGIDFFYTEFITGEKFRNKFLDGTEVMYGAYIDDELTGVVSVSKGNTISCVFVREGYQRKGIGRMLLETAIEVVTDRGASEIKLNASPYAEGFYRSMGFADTGEKSKYNGIVYTPMKKEFVKTKDSFIGISSAYSDSDGRIATDYSGFADKENNIPVDENTIFPACSISKFITAICVMKASEQGLIDIDAPANNYLSNWKLRTSAGDESKASIRSLLCHASGIIDGEDGFYGLRRNDPVISLTDILDGKTSYNNRPAREGKIPWSEFEYSDAGYCVLQMMLEDIAHMPFEQAAKEMLFDPIGLARTFFASPKNVEKYEKEFVMSTGYDETGAPIQGKYPQVPDLAASGLWTTPQELLTIACEFSKAYNGKSSLLKESSAKEIAKPSEKFSWIGLGVFMGGENEIISRGWGENGQSMLKINYATGEAAVVMTDQNPGVDQTESGIEELINKLMM